MDAVRSLRRAIYNSIDGGRAEEQREAGHRFARRIHSLIKRGIKARRYLAGIGQTRFAQFSV